MRVLITGATGFVARHLIPAITDEHELILLGHVESRMPHAPGISRLTIDLTKSDFAERLPEVDAIVHLAQANVSFPTSAGELFGVNTASTVTLLEHARRVGVTRFVFASSASVYGPGERPWSEEDDARAADFYSATKLASERFVGAYAGLFATTILRLVAPYGPGQVNRMIPRLISRVNDGRPIALNDGGRPRMNPIYVEDVVRVVRAALADDRHHLVNVAGSEIASIRDIGETIGRVLGVEPIFEEGHAKAGDIIAENRRMREVFEIENLVSLEDGIARTAAAG